MLRLEVTETAVMANPALALATLTGLHELGVRLSIDDYGTGLLVDGLPAAACRSTS